MSHIVINNYGNMYNIIIMLYILPFFDAVKIKKKEYTFNKFYMPFNPRV